ncbi:MAG: PQQ-dependent sugar dehydrogenase, partial [bacterium]|nr:PQQ-dependent sugar dehydrogenase [bacterium]
MTKKRSVSFEKKVIGGGLVIGALFAVVLIFVSGITPRLSANENFSLAPGTLAHQEGDARIYYIDGIVKRWVNSEQAFYAQGFHWEDVQSVSGEVLRQYPEGPELTAESNIVLPGEEAILPDLAPLAARDLFLSQQSGRKILKFTAMFLNKGKGIFELIADPQFKDSTEDGYLDTFEHLVRPDGSFRNRMVGNFLWHELHQHYHYDNFADYVFELVKPATPLVGPIPPAITKKTTFCMRDDVPVALDLPNASPTKIFAVCGRYRQGVSVGWADKYNYTLPDQFIDVHDLPAGVYRLSFVVDPLKRFVEGDQNNNVSVVLLELNPSANTVRVIASAAPFRTPENRFPDGLLVQAEGDNRVYVMYHNKKRWIQSEEIFTSYGFQWGEIYQFPRGAVDAIPKNYLIRLAGTSTAYVLNEDGYRRRILNPEVLRSYGWTSDDIAEVNQTEFDRYPESDLVILAGDNRVFSIRSKRFVGTYDSLRERGFEPKSVHQVNAVDFNAYASAIVAQNLFVPWDVVFLPEGDLLVTERSGTLRRIGSHSAAISIPAVAHTGEGGLMGIALHPNFKENKFVYLYYTSNADGTKNRIARFRLEGDALVEDRVIIDNIPAAIYHDGGQIAFGPDGLLYATTGDANTPNLAQDLNSLAGKTLRLTPDGAIPSDNPFGTAVWSYGHRNAQGISWDNQGRMWQTEHGRSGALSGFDELNMVEKGKNYGWPVIQGDETRAGMVSPVRHSGADVTWAPSGIVFVDGKLYFAGLKGATLYAVTFGEDGSVVDFKPSLVNVFGRL